MTNNPYIGGPAVPRTEIRPVHLAGDPVARAVRTKEGFQAALAKVWNDPKLSLAERQRARDKLVEGRARVNGEPPPIG